MAGQLYRCSSKEDDETRFGLPSRLLCIWSTLNVWCTLDGGSFVGDVLHRTRRNVVETSIAGRRGEGFLGDRLALTASFVVSTFSADIGESVVVANRRSVGDSFHVAGRRRRMSGATSRRVSSAHVDVLVYRL